MGLEQDPVATKELTRVANRFAALERCKRLCQRCMFVFHESLVLQLGEPQHHRLAGRDVAEHPYEQILNELEAADWLTKLLPLDRVSQRMLVGAHRATLCKPRDARSRHSQDFRAVLERVRLLESIGLRHLAILKRDKPVLHHPKRHLGLDLLDGETGVVLLNDEAFDLS